MVRCFVEQTRRVLRFFPQQRFENWMVPGEKWRRRLRCALFLSKFLLKCQIQKLTENAECDRRSKRWSSCVDLCLSIGCGENATPKSAAFTTRSIHSKSSLQRNIRWYFQLEMTTRVGSLKRIWREEHLRGLYRGLGPTIMGRRLLN